MSCMSGGWSVDETQTDPGLRRMSRWMSRSQVIVDPIDQVSMSRSAGDLDSRTMNRSDEIPR